MTSKIVVNNIEADSGISTVTFNSNIQGNFVGNVNTTGVSTFSNIRVTGGTISGVSTAGITTVYTTNISGVSTAGITTVHLSPTVSINASNYAGPTFRVGKTDSSQNISNNTSTKVTLNTETIDTDNAFDNATNYRFTPQVAGYYFISAGVYFAQQGTSWAYGACEIRKNGTAVAAGGAPPFNGNSIFTHVSDIVYLNGTTDYIELFGFASATGTIPIIADPNVTFLSGTLIRP